MTKKAYLEGATPYPPDVIKEYSAKGWWLNLTYGDLLDRSTSLYPDKPAVIDADGQARRIGEARAAFRRRGRREPQ